MPPAVVNVVHAFFFVAVHTADAAPVPLSVTVALSAGAALPCCTATLREPGLTASTNGGGAVIRSVSYTTPGDPAAPAAETVIVST